MRVERVGPYEVVRELGRGGMGVVYRARHVELGRDVALKLMLGAALADVSDLARFRREAEAVAQLRHPNVVRLFEVGADAARRPYMAMELVEGETLEQRLKRAGPLAEADAARIVATLARALAYAHERGILHRDVKPANVLMRGDEPVLTDFGLAKQTDAQGRSLTVTGELMGTPSYASPEQVSGERGDVGGQADVYSLGATLYALLTGGPPFRGATINVITAVMTKEPPPPSG